jgi:pseudouridine kinase
MANHNISGAARVAVFGGAVLDRKYHARARLVPGTSNPVDGSHSHGGVARNVAENLARLGVPVAFSSIVGTDETGTALLRHLETLQVDTAGVARTDARPTAEYAAILDPANDLALGIADMAVFDHYDLECLDRAWSFSASAEWVFADCNLPADILAELVNRCRASGKRFCANTVSSPKSAKLRTRLTGIDYLFTNRDEAAALLGEGGRPDTKTVAEALREAGAAAAIVTDGGAGYALLEDGAVSWHTVAPARPVDITGAGDAMIAGTIRRLLAGDRLAQAARAGALLAARTTETTASVLPELSPEYFGGLTGPAITQG